MEGIFRVAASRHMVEACKDNLDKGLYVDIFALDGRVVTDLLKLFIRELPDPLLTFELYDALMCKAKIASRKCFVIYIRSYTNHTRPYVYNRGVTGHPIINRLMQYNRDAYHHGSSQDDPVAAKHQSSDAETNIHVFEDRQGIIESEQDDRIQFGNCIRT